MFRKQTNQPNKTIITITLMGFTVKTLLFGGSAASNLSPRILWNPVESKSDSMYATRQNPDSREPDSWIPRSPTESRFRVHVYSREADYAKTVTLLKI